MLVASLPEDVGSMLPRGLFKDGSKSISLYGISPPSDMGRYVHTLEIHPLGGGAQLTPCGDWSLPAGQAVKRYPLEATRGNGPSVFSTGEPRSPNFHYGKGRDPSWAQAARGVEVFPPKYPGLRS